MQASQSSQHRQAILNLIARKKRIARVDIARITKINQGRITALTSELLSQGFIIENKQNEDATNKGRPRIALELASQAVKVIGLKLTAQEITAGIFDFTGSVLTQKCFKLENEQFSSEQIIEIIVGIISNLVDLSESNFDEIKALGVGLPGFVDYSTGFVHWSPFLNDTPVNFLSLLQEQFTIPVRLDNDVNLASIAEYNFGLGRQYKNFIVVTAEHGVGMGLVMNGKVFRGMRGVGNEFGHTKIELNGALCRCGQRGCLEAYVADYALLREANIISPLPYDDQSTTSEKISKLLQAAQEGNPVAEKIFQNAANALGTGLANLVNLFDPELIILSGRQMKYEHLYHEKIEQELQNNIIQSGNPIPMLKVHSWDDLLWARGAAAFAIETVIEQIANYQLS